MGEQKTFSMDEWKDKIKQERDARQENEQKNKKHAEDGEIIKPKDYER